jgi:hypothetical protein
MQEGLQLWALLEKIATLRTSGLRAEHVAFRRIQPLMARNHLGYEYTRVDDSSRLHEEDIDDELIIERLCRIFKDMPPYTPCPVEEYSASRPPKKVSSRGRSPQVLVFEVIILTLVAACCRRTSRSLYPCLRYLSLRVNPERGQVRRPRSGE